MNVDSPYPRPSFRSRTSWLEPFALAFRLYKDQWAGWTMVFLLAVAATQVVLYAVNWQYQIYHSSGLYSAGQDTSVSKWFLLNILDFIPYILISLPLWVGLYIVAFEQLQSGVFNLDSVGFGYKILGRLAIVVILLEVFRSAFSIFIDWVWAIDPVDNSFKHYVIRESALIPLDFTFYFMAVQRQSIISSMDLSVRVYVKYVLFWTPITLANLIAFYWLSQWSPVQGLLWVPVTLITFAFAHIWLQKNPQAISVGVGSTLTSVDEDEEVDEIFKPLFNTPSGKSGSEEN